MPDKSVHGQVVPGRKRPGKAEKKVSDKPKPWPYQAKEDRDRTAEDLAEIVKQLTPLLDASNDAEVLRRVAKSLRAAQEGLRRLEGQGAQTRPQ